MSDSLWSQGLQHARLPYPSPSPRVCANSCPLNWWCYPTISSSVIPFSSCPQPFPASEYLPIGWLFTSGGQSIGASAGHNSCCIGQRFCTLHVLEFFIAREWAHQADLFITMLVTFRSMICCSKCHFFSGETVVKKSLNNLNIQHLSKLDANFARFSY